MNTKSSLATQILRIHHLFPDVKNLGSNQDKTLLNLAVLEILFFFKFELFSPLST